MPNTTPASWGPSVEGAGDRTQHFQPFNFSVMPCPVIDIDPYKDEIIKLFENYYTLSQILQYLLKYHLVCIGQSILQYCLSQ